MQSYPCEVRMSIEKFIDRHSPTLQFVGGILATALSITVFAFSNFSTKEEVKEKIEAAERSNDKVLQQIDKRLERMENKIDSLAR